MSKFEEEYEDVLQNIEFGIVRVYREHPQMTDYHALSAVEALLHAYHAEIQGREVSPSSLDPLAQEVLASVHMVCEWRLGREDLFLGDAEEPLDVGPEPITLEEIVACLKRIRKSINHWTRRGGRQGYLTFVDQFIA